MSSGISVCLLSKNCPTFLDECLASVSKFLKRDLGDEIVIVDTGSTDNTIEVARSYDAVVIERPDLCVYGMHDLVKQYLPDRADLLTKDPQFKDGFLADFSAARQIATDAAKNELVFWIDSDDVLSGGAELRDFCKEYFKDPKHSVLFLPYDYAFDPDGAITTVLHRERILRKSEYFWKGLCHESMIPSSGQPQVIVKCPLPQCRIVHKNGRPHEFSDIRNYTILRSAYDKEGWKDPRTEFYLGNAARGLALWNESMKWYGLLLQRSGSRDDRIASALNIAYIHLMKGRGWKAVDWFFQCTKINPHDQRPYFGIARAYFDLKRFQECLLWTAIGRSIPPSPQVTSVDPNAFDYYPTMFEALSFKELGQAQAAIEVSQQAASLRPNNPASKALVSDIGAWAQREQIKAAVQGVLSLASSQEVAIGMIHGLRPEIRKAIPELQLETFCTPPKKSITFLCGNTVETWDPTSESDGVGGSEKMVIGLAREFARRGFLVDVYGNPKPENAYKHFDGVTYRPSQSFNQALKRGILIVWRNWGYLDLPLKARKIYMDLHDVQNSGDYRPDRLAKLSGIFFKSKFHAAGIPDSGPNFVTRNAIDPDHFGGPAPGPRDYSRLVYASSADRGLLSALRIFSRVKAIHPRASLDVFYGFTPLYLKRAADVDYQYFGDDNCERHMLDYAEQCFELMDKLGVRFHGRVGHKILADVLRQSSVFLYPTRFPEISCMAALEAQAAGCIPICGDTGALKETVQFGALLDPSKEDDFVSAISKIVSKGADLDTYRSEMSDTVLKAYDIKALAADWVKEFTCTKSLQKSS